MEKGDLVKVNKKGLMGVYIDIIDKDRPREAQRCEVQIVNTLCTHQFLLKDLELINKKF